MSISSAIATKQQQIVDAYTACDNKGATLPATQNLTNLASCISTISGGGGTDNYADVITIENTIKGGTETEAASIEQACNDISMFLYGTSNS